MLPPGLGGEHGRREQLAGGEKRRRRATGDIVAEEGERVAADGQANGHQGRADTTTC